MVKGSYEMDTLDNQLRTTRNYFRSNLSHYPAYSRGAKMHIGGGDFFGRKVLADLTQEYADSGDENQLQIRLHAAGTRKMLLHARRLGKKLAIDGKFQQHRTGLMLARGSGRRNLLPIFRR